MAATCTKKDESPIRASDRTHSPHEDIPFRASSGGDVFVPAASGIRTSAPLDIPRHAVNQAISAVPSALSSLTAWTQARKPVFRPFRSFSAPRPTHKTRPLGGMEGEIRRALFPACLSICRAFSLHALKRVFIPSAIYKNKIITNLSQKTSFSCEPYYAFHKIIKKLP